MFSCSWYFIDAQLKNETAIPSFSRGVCFLLAMGPRKWEAVVESFP